MTSKPESEIARLRCMTFLCCQHCRISYHLALAQVSVQILNVLFYYQAKETVKAHARVTLTYENYLDAKH